MFSSDLSLVVNGRMDLQKDSTHPHVDRHFSHGLE